MFIFKKNQNIGNLDKFKRDMEEGDFFGVKYNLFPEFVDQIISPDDGKRAIHLACKEGYFDIAKLLVEQKCNIESETETRYRPIHWGSMEGHFNIVKLLIENKCDIESETKWKERPIHLSCEKGFLDISTLLINNQCDIETETAGKYRPIHLACENGFIKIVKLLLENKCNIESETNWKERPIHLACINGHLEIVKLLTKEKCKTECKNIDNKTPLDLAIEHEHQDIVNYLTRIKINKQIFDCVRQNDVATFDALYNTNVLVSKDYNSGLSLLETALNNNADKIIKYIKEKGICDTEILSLTNIKEDDENSKMVQLMKECILFRSVRDHHQEGFQSSCFPNVLNGDCKIAGSSFLEIAAEHGCSSFIDDLLKKSIYEKNTWQRAKENALIKGHPKLVDIISKRESLLTSRQKVNFTILHTAVCDNDADMVRYILENGLVDPNSNHEIFGTPLALGYALCHETCVEVLEEFHVDVNTQNKYWQTPIHEAIASGMDKHCINLIENTQNLDKRGFFGFTGLQCAVMNGCDELCGELLKKGSDCGLYVELPTISMEDITGNEFVKSIFRSLSNRENALTLCLKFHKTIYSCFLNNLNPVNVNSCDGNGNTLVHLAIETFQIDLVEKLLKLGAKTDSINRLGQSPLLKLLNNGILCVLDDKLDKLKIIIDLLVTYGADVNKIASDGESALQIGLKYHNESLMLALFMKTKNHVFINEDDFNFVFAQHWFDFIERLVPCMMKKTLCSYIKSDIMHTTMKFGRLRLVQTLFENADDQIKELFIEDFIRRVVSDNYEEKIFDWLVQTQINVLRLIENGEDTLIDLMTKKSWSFFLKLLECDKKNDYINAKNVQNTSMSPNSLVKLDSGRSILDLDDHQLNCEDVHGNTPLMILFKEMSPNDTVKIKELTNIVKSLICRGADIYMTTSRGAVVINECQQKTVRVDVENYFKKINKN